jgi:hypothetical protein
MKRSLSVFRNPVFYGAALFAGYLMFGMSGAGASSAVGVSEACAGTCKPSPGDICNIGGGDNQNYCDASTAGCGI